MLKLAVGIVGQGAITIVVNQSLGAGGVDTLDGEGVTCIRVIIIVKHKNHDAAVFIRLILVRFSIGYIVDTGDGYNDGAATDAKLQYPLDLDVDRRDKLLWIADTYNNKIRKIELSNNHVSSISVEYPLHQPGGLAFSEDTLYIANTNLHEIVRIDLRSGPA